MAKTNLACPKCGARMVEFERTTILVEQCQECRGIFLDHGELERLIDVEGGGWSGLVGPPSDLTGPGVRVRGRSKQRTKVVRDLFGE